MSFVDGRSIFLGYGNQQVFERQFQLLDLAFDFLRGFAESQLLQLGDPQAQGLNQLVVDPQCRRDLGILRLQSCNHRLQYGGIIWQILRYI